MLAILISGTQTMARITTQLRDTNRKNGQEKTTKMYFTVILRANSAQKGYRKRMIEIWAESIRYNTISQRLVDQARMILKKGWLSDFEILEMYTHLSCEEYEQEPST